MGDKESVDIHGKLRPGMNGDGSAADSNRYARLPLGVSLGIILTTGCILLFEIALTRYFSFKLWYHYAFMIISITLLGLSAGSIALALNRRRLSLIPAHRLISYFALLFAITIIVSLPLLSSLSNLWLGEESSSTLVLLLIISTYWLVLFIPFFFAGATISWAISTYARNISLLYALDLLGASLGALLSVWLMTHFYAEQVLIFAAVIASLSSLFFFTSKRNRKKGFLVIILFILGGAIALSFYSDFLVGISTTPQKGLARDLKDGGRVLASRPGMTGRVDVLRTTLKRFAWGIDGNYEGPFPDELAMRIDGDAMTMIINYDGDFSRWSFTDALPGSLPYFMGSPKKVVIVGPGGGMEVVNAVGRGAENVTGVEVNRRIIELVKNDFAEFSGDIYNHPRVNIVHSDGRNYLENTRDRYDLVQLTMVDTATAISSGALSLSEDYLYTTEAFKAYIKALEDDGYLVLGRTRHETLWLLTLLHAATQGSDIDLSEHIFIAENPANFFSLVVLFKKSPLTPAEVERGIGFLENARMELVYAPLHEDGADSKVIEFLSSADKDLFILTYPEDIVPETDDMPFYFRSSKWSSLFGAYSGAKGNLLIILGVAILFVITLIIAPLVITSKEVIRHNALFLWYFAFIGLGFILLEIALMVKFTIFLGHPVRSITVTLFSLLFFSGVGSYLSRAVLGKGENREPKARMLVRMAMPFIVVFILAGVYGAYLPSIFSGWMGLGLNQRFMLTIMLIAPLGIMMGMPLPIGITFLESRERKLILWAWGLNGVASVVGSILCIIIAHLTGYRSLFFLSAVCYLAAVSCLLRLHIKTQAI